MPWIHSAKVVICTECKNTQIISSHGDVIHSSELPFCENCQVTMVYLKKPTLKDWIKEP